VGVLMDLMPRYGGTTALRPRKLVDVRYPARGPRKDLVCVALSYRRGGPSGWASKGPSGDPKLSRFYGARAMVEPPNVKMIGYARSTTEPMRAPRHRHGLRAEPPCEIVRPEDENRESNLAPRVPFRS
jgi:hypothetical protein